MQVCYNNFSRSREFTLLTHRYPKYDAVTRLRAVSADAAWHTAFLDATKHRLIQPRGQILGSAFSPLIGQKSSSSGIESQLLTNYRQLSTGNSCSRKCRASYCI